MENFDVSANLLGRELTRNVVVTTEKNGFPFFPVVTTTFLALGLAHYAVGGYSMWVKCRWGMCEGKLCGCG